MPAGVPEVPELGVTSAPLKSASFFIGEHCKAFNGKPALSHALPLNYSLSRWMCRPHPQRTLCCARPRTGIRPSASRKGGK